MTLFQEGEHCIRNRNHILHVNYPLDLQLVSQINFKATVKHFIGCTSLFDSAHKQDSKNSVMLHVNFSFLRISLCFGKNLNDVVYCSCGKKVTHATVNDS